SAALVEEIKELTKDWKKAELPKLDAPPVEKQAKFTQKIITMPQSQQVHLSMGERGIRRNSPDYYKLLVMDYVLGTGPGFTDRLSAHLRDREGLGYTGSGNIKRSGGSATGP